MLDPMSHLRFWAVACAGLAIDLLSKSWAFHTLRQQGQRVVIPHVLEWQVLLNDGALFGIGHGQTGLFIVASLLALILVVWMFAHTPKEKWFLQLALGAILAGALGNMYDRMNVRLVPGVDPTRESTVYYEQEMTDHGPVLYEYPRIPGRKGLHGRMHNGQPEEPLGYVRDFIKIPTKIWGDQDAWPWVFNVADSLLVAGVSILAIHLWRERKSRPQAAAAAANPV
jgi:signal peptidase II